MKLALLGFRLLSRTAPAKGEALPLSLVHPTARPFKQEETMVSLGDTPFEEAASSRSAFLLANAWSIFFPELIRESFVASGVFP